jgi:hypothetical protein
MTDPYLVSCPVCGVPAGTRCHSRIKELDFAHRRRRRWASRVERRTVVASHRADHPTSRAQGRITA